MITIRKSDGEKDGEGIGKVFGLLYTVDVYKWLQLLPAVSLPCTFPKCNASESPYELENRWKNQPKIPNHDQNVNARQITIILQFPRNQEISGPSFIDGHRFS